MDARPLPESVIDRLTIAKRVGVALLTLGAAFAGAWILLPGLRALLLPDAVAGGWIIGPARALRFAACAVTAAVVVPLVLRAIGREWRARDLETRGAPLDPFANRPGERARLLIMGGLLLVVYGAGAAFYLLSYTEVTPERVAVHSPLGTRSFAYDQIEALERVAPRGGQAERYAIRFDDGSWGYFGTDNEGVTSTEVRAIADHVSRRAGLTWVPTER